MPIRSLFALLSICLAASAQPSAQPRVADEDIQFTSAGAVLAGTLAIPSATPPVAGVVLVHGSGQRERLGDFATTLAARGIAAITWDKRGVGKSGGRYAGPEVGTSNADPANLSLLAQDASAAMDRLGTVEALQGKPLGFLGISQAGWIIPIAARTRAATAFMVFWSGPVTTVHEQMAFNRMTDGTPDFWNTHTAADVKKAILSSRLNFPFADTDPRPLLSELAIPGLWLFSPDDPNVPVDLSIERLAELNLKRTKPFEYRKLSAAGHDLPFLDAVNESARWIREVVSKQ